MKGLPDIKATMNEKPNHSAHRYENHRKGKDINTIIRVLNMDEVEVKAFLGETEEVVKKQHKRKIMECYHCPMMQPKDMIMKQLGVGNKSKSPTQQKDIRMKLDDYTNQLTVVDNKRIADYES